MAQLVEQRIRNAQVVGSSPTTSFKPLFLRAVFLYNKMEISRGKGQFLPAHFNCFILL